MTSSRNFRLNYLGHAGFILEAGGTRILMDPWFFPAFLQSWFPYPDNRFLLETVTAGRFDYLYISHLHEDHFDRKVLGQLDKSVKVLCPNYRSKGVGKRLAKLGFRNLIPLGHKQSVELPGGITATMLLDTSHKEDSGLLLEYEGFRFLDLNDCNASLSELPENIDLLAAQYSGAMWYPNCYEYTPEVMAQKVAQVRSDLMKSLIRKCEVTQAQTYLPCAGPACFLDPALAEFNDHDATIFPLWEDVAAEFAGNCPAVPAVRLSPGDALELPGLERTTAAAAQPSSDLNDYSARRKAEWGEFYSGEEPAISSDDLKVYFQRLQKRNDYLAKDVNKYIRVSVSGKSWGVRLGAMAEDFVIEGEDPYPPEYELITSARVLRAVLDDETGWEEALLSMRVRLRRIPDVFDSRFMGLLRYGNEPVQTLQMIQESGCAESIERDGLIMQRFCPHAGEDLNHAIICDGVIECPRHHWKWDAATGRCLEGGTLPLRVGPAPARAAAENSAVRPNASLRG